MPELAIRGGAPVRTTPFPPPNNIRPEERAAVLEVMDSGVLSQFLGSWHDDFHGGPQVRALEHEWAQAMDTDYAVSVNSAAWGLWSAVGAARVSPGDEVICTPYTMSATAMAIIAWGGVPVFADIRADDFCVDPAAIERAITPRTRAIMVVHLFGQSADMDAIMDIAQRHDLVVIEDAAQAPGATYKGKKIGGLGDMTVFSLNYHKHIHSGEGGVTTTNRPELAKRLQLVRNHGENAWQEIGVTAPENTWGLNLRMTELTAAIARSQLRKLPRLLAQRQENAAHLHRAWSAMPGLTPMGAVAGRDHVYYTQQVMYDQTETGIPREAFVDAVNAELPTAPDRTWPLMAAGYGAPLYLLPLFQQRTATGTRGFPFNQISDSDAPRYRPGLCPRAEEIESRIITTEYMRPPCTIQDMDDVIAAFDKVLRHKDELNAIPA